MFDARQCHIHVHVGHTDSEHLLGDVNNGTIQGQSLTLADDDSVCQNEWKLLPVNAVVFHDHEPALDHFHVVEGSLKGSLMWSN